MQSELIHIGMKPGGIFERLVVPSSAARRQVGLDTGQTPKRGTGGVRWTSLFWHADRRCIYHSDERASERAIPRSVRLAAIDRSTRGSHEKLSKISVGPSAHRVLMQFDMFPPEFAFSRRCNVE